MTSSSYTPASPDAHGTGLLETPLDPLRYDGQMDDPHEVGGTLCAMMPSNVRVLDVGCGTGSVTIMANRGKNNDVVAIEPDASRTQVAVSRGVNAHTGFLTSEFLSEKGPFDVIVFADVLEHLASPHEMLEMAIGGLAPGGCILASVPNAAHWSLRLNLLRGRFDYTELGLCDATHLRWFTKSTIRALFETQGLHVSEIRPTAGVGLAVYRSRAFRLLPVPGRLVRAGIRSGATLRPGLFACQFVVKGVKPTSTAMGGT